MKAAGTGPVNYPVPLHDFPPNSSCWEGGCSGGTAGRGLGDASLASAALVWPPAKQQAWAGGNPHPEDFGVQDGCVGVEGGCSRPTSCLEQARDLAEPWWFPSFTQGCGHAGDRLAATCIRKQPREESIPEAACRGGQGGFCYVLPSLMSWQEAPLRLGWDLPTPTALGLLTQRAVLGQRNPGGSHR